MGLDAGVVRIRLATLVASPKPALSVFPGRDEDPKPSPGRDEDLRASGCDEA